ASARPPQKFWQHWRPAAALSNAGAKIGHALHSDANFSEGHQNRESYPMFPSMMTGRTLVHGDAQGDVLFSDMGLSFWGGVDAGTGRIIDRHHPLCGADLAGKVLAIPSGRGSCSGSGVLLELILNGHAPAALVFE